MILVVSNAWAYGVLLVVGFLYEDRTLIANDQAGFKKVNNKVFLKTMCSISIKVAYASLIFIQCDYLLIDVELTWIISGYSFDLKSEA